PLRSRGDCSAAGAGLVVCALNASGYPAPVTLYERRGGRRVYRGGDQHIRCRRADHHAAAMCLKRQAAQLSGVAALLCAPRLQAPELFTGERRGADLISGLLPLLILALLWIAYLRGAVRRPPRRRENACFHLAIGLTLFSLFVP